MPSPDGVDTGIGMILYTDVGSLETLSLLVLLIIAVHALISALMIRVVDGGHPLVGATDFVIMMWIGGGSAVVNRKGNCLPAGRDLKIRNWIVRSTPEILLLLPL
ncbi:hypothetical protein [Methanohalophilus euhalobius]|nr:hypothetical protein [Methanohalophilus euhalobius]